MLKISKNPKITVAKSQGLKLTALTTALTIFLTPITKANVVGTNTQNFNATSSSNDYVTVYSSKTLGQGIFGLGLYVNNAVNTLPYFDSEDGESEESNSSRSKYNDSVLGSEVGIGYGVLKNLDVGLQLPAVLYQDIKDKEDRHGEFKQQGITEYRIGSKVHILGNSVYGLGAVVSVNVDTTKDNPYQGKGSGITYNTELVGDLSYGHFDFAANAGFRWKTPGKQKDEEAPIEPYKSQIAASTAVSYRFTNSDTRWITEIFGSTPTQGVRDESNRNSTTAELISGLKIFAKDNLAYQVGAGTELKHSVASPDWRIYAGVNWTGKAGIPAFRSSPKPVITDEVEEQPDEVMVVQDVFFELDSDQMVVADNFESLDNLAKTLREKGFNKLIIEGHTCSLGSARYNISLSQKRANKIRSLLVKNYGVDGHKIFAVGRGESRPVESNATEAGREQNRRVEFKIFRDDEQLSSINMKKKK